MQSVHWLDALTPPLEQHLQKLAASVGALISSISPVDGEQKYQRSQVIGNEQAEWGKGYVSLTKPPELKPADIVNSISAWSTQNFEVWLRTIQNPASVLSEIDL